jgi:NAD-dependent DNA ligase
MTDDEYDRQFEELKRLSPAHPFLTVVGAPVAGEGTLLPYPMASLDKVRMGEGMLTRWLRRCTHESFSVSEKLDGLSALYTRSAGKQSLYLRGDGVKGLCITGILGSIKGIPSAGFNDCIVRGELVLPLTSTPAGSIGRSLVNGWVHRNAKEELKSVDFVAYQVLEPSNLTRQQQLTWLTSNGFKIPWSQVLTNVSEDSLLRMLEDRKASGTYPLDGMVIGTNSIPFGSGGGEAKNPVDAVAFKAALDEQREETTVITVEWNLSRQGNWIPRIQIEPVEIGGANIQWLSGHNAAAITEGVIGPAARIIIRRSGDVIPTLEKVLLPSPSGALMPTAGSWEWDAGHVHAKRVEGTAEGTQEALEQAILHALQVLEVDGIGPGLVKKMVAASFNSMSKVWNATADSLKDSLGPTRSVQFVQALRDAFKKATPMKLLIASNLLPRGVGERRLRPLFAIHDNPQRWQRRMFNSVAGWSSDSMDGLFAVLPAALEWCKSSFGGMPSTAPASAPAPAAAHSVAPQGIAVFTGVRDKELEAIAVAAGWEIADTITKATTVLIVPDGEIKPSAKVQSAKAKGITICRLSDFRARF